MPRKIIFNNRHLFISLLGNVPVALMFPISDLATIKRMRGTFQSSISLLEASRIAQQSETDNAEAHAIGIYCSLRGMSHIYDNPRLVIIYHPWTFTVVLSFDDFGKVAKFTSSQRQAFGKRPFHISCTRPLTPCGASASKCNCKSNKYLRKYKENLYYLRFL